MPRVELKILAFEFSTAQLTISAADTMEMVSSTLWYHSNQSVKCLGNKREISANRAAAALDASRAVKENQVTKQNSSFLQQVLDVRCESTLVSPRQETTKE